MRVFIRPPPAAVATHTESPSTADAIDYVVGKPAVELRIGVESARRIAAQSAHGRDPDVAGAFIRRDEQTARWAKPSACVKTLPLAVLVQAETVLRRRPDPVAIDANVEHVVVRQTVRPW